MCIPKKQINMILNVCLQRIFHVAMARITAGSAYLVLKRSKGNNGVGTIRSLERVIVTIGN